MNSVDSQDRSETFVRFPGSVKVFVDVHDTESLLTQAGWAKQHQLLLCCPVEVWKHGFVRWRVKVIEFKRLKPLLWGRVRLKIQSVPIAAHVVLFQGLVTVDKTPAEVTCQFFSKLENQQKNSLCRSSSISFCSEWPLSTWLMDENEQKNYFYICVENKMRVDLKALTVVCM